jgi:hypothetical protein
MFDNNKTNKTRQENNNNPTCHNPVAKPVTSHNQLLTYLKIVLQRESLQITQLHTLIDKLLLQQTIHADSLVSS